MNFYLIFGTALIPLVIGFIWYNPKIFGNAWMKESDMTDDKIKSGNMALIFGLTYVLGLLISMSMYSLTIHQMGIYSVFQGDESPESVAYLKNFNDTYGMRFRTFKHGSLHGVIAALFIALPIIGINALFERKSFKYVAIHVGFWIVCMGIIGGIVCQFA